MRNRTRIVAALQSALIFPAALFLTSVLVATGEPPQYDLALAARRIISWYSGPWALWLLLVGLPIVVLLGGCATLALNWNDGTELPPGTRTSLSMIPSPFATLLVAGDTMMSGAILAVVALHMMAN